MVSGPYIVMNIFEQGGQIKTGLKDLSRNFVNDCVLPTR